MVPYRLLQTVQGVHLCTGFEQGFGLGETQAATGAGDADHLAGETELGHSGLLAHEDGLGGRGGGGDVGGLNGDRHYVV